MGTRKDSGISGVLPVIKNPGPTSHDVVQIARRALGTRQVGHTGTLDPAARGLLVLCLGGYTKLVPYLTESDKSYSGFIALGIETATDDREGDPTMLGDASSVTLERIHAVAARFRGEIEQVPPRYSAIKVAGKKLYEYARENVKIEPEPREVTVYNFDIQSLEQPVLAGDGANVPKLTHATLEVAFKTQHATGKMRILRFTSRVSSGTYVRSLARDLGRELGCGGFLLTLERDGVGPVTLAQAMPQELLESAPERAAEFMLRGAASLDTNRFPVFTIIRGFAGRLANGQPLNEKMMENATVAAAVPSGAICAITRDDGALLAIVEAERFDAQRRANPYDSRFDVHFRPVRIFPGGLN
ncbi:MAG: tRNA pseudouridine(55) synthase TruB [Candidatus Sumerlaeaceae bacterium]|nr:tRNA pseudouridine(55) synthase TruB [Candidatus Sumerlaeaceae bacterium]